MTAAFERGFTLTRPLSGGAAMLAVFSDTAAVQRMLDFEAALARAEAAHGVIPQSAVAAIVAACNAEQIDLPALAEAAASAGNLAIPLVKQLTAAVSRRDAEAGKYVHWGATSQDAIDTGLMLQLREALQLFHTEVDGIIDALAQLARAHRDTPMIGRTWMQHALPISFGLKAAGWLDAMLNHRNRIIALQADALALQFGGAAGTLASLRDQGLAVAQSLAQDLDLPLPAMPWHTQRDRIADIATALGMLTGSLGKMARDVSLLMQTDVAEAAEPAAPGKGGSSTMPHKRNPVACAAALTAAVRVPGLVATVLAGMVQEHERALGGWQAEWDALPEIAVASFGALRQMREVAAGLSVDADRMRANLDITHGLIMGEAVMLALGGRIGRLNAHHLVEAASRQAAANGRHLREVLGEDQQVTQHLSPQELDALFAPVNYLGATGLFVDRVLARHQQEQSS
ncbi:3-carboxy-cis,cis-muconate cycloisomerase [Noviherbaspirillum pedocola]|uniref:3-carboxy-cis,cis-muconate cycloisomerase n=1 Tax=Noviherbaspirillum pedocola TaxID=2801341 RepID=A0A934SQI1_9BURK|nr:3-carboxy-cis,cis-muconate cycloisomerase [Noviherbaspirillum pedocola]MBK4733266.1 3-carboxy-cis,cis-muconate cycloisomerase [Noviherbaspirillum pedocola]